MTILPPPHDKVNANLTNSLYQVPLYLSIARPAKNEIQKPARIPPQTPPPRGQNPKTKFCENPIPRK